jgi:hypothetical protein
MKCICKAIPLAVLILVGCGRNDGPRPGGWVETETKKITVREGDPRPVTRWEGPGHGPDVIKKVLKPEKVLPKLAGLKIPTPAGWRAQYIEYANEWVIDEEDPKFPTRVTVKRAPVESEGSDMNAYLKHIRKRADDENFIWPEIVQSGNLPDGFFIVGHARYVSDVTNKNPELGFIVIRNLGGDRIRFKCVKAKDDATRQEALEMCKNAGL